MPKSLVLELQDLAMNAEADVAALLRKALAIATKLKSEDFRAWAASELNGYETEEVPQYRLLQASLKVHNPYRGLQPLFIEDEGLHRHFTTIHVRDPLPNLATLLRGRDVNSGPITFSLGQKEEEFLRQNQHGGLALPPVRIVAPNQIEGILEAVRTAILQWTLKLESEGILGEGLTFSPQEKERAMASQSIRIENFQGILGNVSQSTVSQNLSMKVKKGDFESLKESFESVGVKGEQLKELKDAIDADGKPKKEGTFGKKVAGWIAKMVSLAATGGWDVALGASANLLSEGLGAYYGWTA